VQSLLRTIFHRILPQVAPGCARVFLDADTTMPAMVAISDFQIVYTGDFRRFYMNDEQMEAVSQVTVTLPEGYYISEVNGDGDYEEIHGAWPYGANMDPQLTRQHLMHLPSSCIRTDDGSLASWELSHHFMKMSHHFTYPSHRGQQLGVISELLIAKRYIELGYRPFKGVSDSNEGVIRGSRKSPYWTE
ncbi:hypothetical protein PFISCL1PPCAC_12847, partial [Pristionchus fissidentatus]